ncbi:MAG TPA: EAL domain-containing protein [Steroidobacteraceae bacterium]|nr:EAL domain-containing protein [Steroidobacteraceae bacterium]
MRLRLADTHLRGRLARRLLMVFVLAAVGPVLLTGFLGYRQLLRGADAASTRALHDQVRESALTFFSQLQSASAELALAGSQAAAAGGSRAARTLPFAAVSFVPVRTSGEWRRALAEVPGPLRTALMAGQAVLICGRGEDGRDELILIRPQLSRSRLARATLEPRRMLEQSRPLAAGTGLALAYGTAGQWLLRSRDDPVPRGVFQAMAQSGAGASPATLWHSRDGRWRGGGWNLFLQSGFAAPPIRVLICESAASPIAALSGLRLTIPMMLLGTVAFAAWLAIALLRRYLGPLETLTAATRQLSTSNFDVEVPVQGDDELSELGQDFNRMARSLREQHRELQHRAQVDGLTGLSNRDFFRELLRQHLASGRSSALLYIDLDDFKKVNDSAGHGAGDTLLKEVAARLRRCVRPGDAVARLGGDEFAILLGGGATADLAAATAARILEAIRAPIPVAGAERRVCASIGLALIPVHGHTVDLLLRNADVAMYQAKEQGRNGVAFFSPEMHRRMEERIALEIALQGAVARNELRLHYQPITRAGRLAGVEALVRWARPAEREVGPAEFIPVAEQSDLIVAIGEWVLRQACEDFVRWRAAGIAPGHISINVAPKQLQSDRLVEQLQAQLREQQINPAEIQLEVTESALANGPQAAATLERLHDLGFRLALDDFGTGYSSLSQLQRLPFDVVKIDRSFIVGLPDSQVALQLVRTIVRMSQSLGKLAVAEGVETELQRDVLNGLGCSAMQGYLFGRPVPERQIRGLLQAAAGGTRGSQADRAALASG